MGVQDTHAPDGAGLINIEHSRSVWPQDDGAQMSLDKETLDLLELLAAVQDPDEDVYATQRYYDDGTVVIELPTEDDE